MSTLNARANQAYRDLEAKLEQDECVPNFVSEQDAWEDGWETGYKTAAGEAETGTGSVQVGAQSPEPLRADLEQLAEDMAYDVTDAPARIRAVLAKHPVEPAGVRLAREGLEEMHARMAAEPVGVTLDLNEIEDAIRDEFMRFGGAEIADDARRAANAVLAVIVGAR